MNSMHLFGQLKLKRKEDVDRGYSIGVTCIPSCGENFDMYG
jgi:hypothetical protein